MPLAPKRQTYVGIDPGGSGSIVILFEETNVIEYILMPRTEKDLWTALTKDPNIQRCSGLGVEKVHSMPNDGHKGAFTFGYNFGCLSMAVIAAGIVHEFVMPKVWQSEFGIQGRQKKEPKGALKERCRVKAIQLFPDFPLWSKPRTLGIQRAVCDALLIAEYIRRCRTGQLRRGK